MIDTKYRSIFQPIFDSLSKFLVLLNIKPKTITICAFIMGLGSGLLIAMGQVIPAIIALWLSGLLDVLDGSVARLSNSSSNNGAYMDMIFDRMVEAAIILGFAFILPNYYFTYLIFFVGVIFNFSTFLVAGALFKNHGNKSMHYDIGIVERTEIFIVFTLMIIFNNYIFYILVTFNVLIFLTGILRFIKVIKYSDWEGKN